MVQNEREYLDLESQGSTLRLPSLNSGFENVTGIKLCIIINQVKDV